jgi:hypothetical protein
VVPIRGFGCGRIGVVTHRGSLNDSATDDFATVALNATRNSSIIERGAEGKCSVAAFPVTHRVQCGKRSQFASVLTICSISTANLVNASAFSDS